jgi:Domain of unknown function (DUF4377)
MKARAIIVLTALALLSACSQVTSNERLITVAAKLASYRSAAALKPQNQPTMECYSDCLDIRDESLSLSYLKPKDSIQGFVYAPGYTYKLRVQVRNEYLLIELGTVPHTTWTLLETLEKTPAQ